MSYRRVDSLTHRSRFKLAMSDHEVWELVRLVEDYAMIVSLLDPHADQKMVGASLGVWVDPLGEDIQWKDAAKAGAYSIMPDARVQQAITEAIEETETKPFLNEIPEPTELEKVVAELGRERRSNERLRQVNMSLVRQRAELTGKLEAIREVFQC